MLHYQQKTKSNENKEINKKMKDRISSKLNLVIPIYYIIEKKTLVISL